MRIIVVSVPAEAVELGSDRLWAAGAGAVEERPGSEGRVELRTSLGADDAAARSRLGVVPSDWHVGFEDVDDEPARTWREFARPIRVADDLVISPAWIDHDRSGGASVVRIEPAGSFGLGDHPTTRLSAALTHEVVTPGDRVLDVGCGSGVLSIVAALRRADRVVAIDVAEAAREATVDNAARNGVGGRVDASTVPVAEIAGEFDVVVANILAPALVSMAPSLRRCTAERGVLVVSGVLTGGYDHVIEALRPMRPIDERHLDGWSAVTLAHEQR